MADMIHPDGIYKCTGCGRVYHEYVNGCVEDHGKPRKVELAMTNTQADRLLHAMFPQSFDHPDASHMHESFCDPDKEADRG